MSKAFNRSFKIGILSALCFILPLPSARAEVLLGTETVERIFSQVSRSASLADPAMILIDKKTSKIVFEKNADSPRRPASILKLLSTAVALEYLGDKFQFETRAYYGPQPRTASITGNFDPWMVGSSVEVAKGKRASLNNLASKIIAKADAQSGFKVKSMVLRHSGIYSSDLRTLARYFRARGVAVKFITLPPVISSSYLADEVGAVLSPTVGEMVKYSLTWSDNLLAERLAQTGARAAKLSMSDAGVEQAMKKLLAKFEIDSSSLRISDGSGLSKSDRISALLVAKLLVKFREDGKFTAIYDGLPISGLTGTLEERYFSTSPEGIGLIHAKTGTLNGTVSLAGYVDAGDREYIFVVIADRIKKGNSATRQARNAIDRALSKIASPFFVAR